MIFWKKFPWDHRAPQCNFNGGFEFFENPEKYFFLKKVFAT